MSDTGREGLLALAVGVGLSVVAEIFEEELTQLLGLARQAQARPARRGAS